MLTTVTVRPFSQPIGPRSPLPATPVEVFKLFFTTTLLQYIVEQTNLYAFQCMGEELYQTWEKITVIEVEAFMGFMILMGIVKLPSISDYWSKDPTYHYSPIAERMSRTSFFDLQKYLHFADNTTLALRGTPNYQK